MTDAGTHLFWITSRAAGITALVCASVAVCAGLALGGRIGWLRGRSAQLRTVHEALSIATLAALAVHGLALLGDGWLRPSLLDIAVPFALDHRPLWTGLGIVAGYGLAVLSLSYYARARIGVARWRALHRLSRSSGCSASCTRSAPAPTPGRPGSCCSSRSSRCRRSPCSRCASRRPRRRRRPPARDEARVKFVARGFPSSAGRNTVRPCR